MCSCGKFGGVCSDHAADMVRENARMRKALERVADAFSMMPALNAAVPGYTVDEVRAEVNSAIDWFVPTLNAALGEVRMVEPPGGADREALRAGGTK